MKKFLISFLVVLVINIKPHDKADLVIYSCDRPLQLYALLESIERYVTHLGQVHVIVRSTRVDYKKAYKKVFVAFPNLIIKEQFGSHDFKKVTLQSLAELPHEYILFAVDDIIITGPIDLDYCVKTMQRFNAYGFYLRLGKNCTFGYPKPHPVLLPTFEFDTEGLCAWRFNKGTCDWGYPHTVDMTLYKKKDILYDLKTLKYSAPNTLEGHWAGASGNIMHKLGICFEHSRIVNIPMNRVQNEVHNYNMGISPEKLLQIFNEGKKIDIKQFYKIDNKNSHMDAWPNFIQREKTKNKSIYQKTC